MARPTQRTRHPLCEAVVSLRHEWGETQQGFAHMLGMAIATIARYETSRPPSGTALATLAFAAQSIEREDLVSIFLNELGKELRLADIKGQFFESNNRDKGYLWVNIDSPETHDYAWDFYVMIRQFKTGSEEESKEARKVLQDFSKLVSHYLGGQQ